MPRKSNAKEKLMEAALELIWGNSYGSTSVDAICEKANVKKGSFYYFFESKSGLAVEAMEANWQQRKQGLDSLFSPSTPPLERLGRYFDYVLERQTAMHSECGCVLGCPLFSLGCEVSTQDPAIREKVREILDLNVKYFESAIRDAHAEGLISVPDAPAKARMLFALYQGTLTLARIQNNLDPIREAKRCAFELLGASAILPCAA